MPLAEPIQVFSIDFQDWQHNMQPAEAILGVDFTQAGVFNAVAMWFDLHLDEESSLSTSPYLEDKGPTWQQAVQWVEEVKVEPGLHLQLAAKHDTYGITFSLRCGCRPCMPLYSRTFPTQNPKSVAGMAGSQ